MPTYKSKALRDYEAVYGPGAPTATTLPQYGPQTPTYGPVVPSTTHASLPDEVRKQIAANLTTIAAGNKKTKVDAAVAPLFQALIDKAAQMGYQIGDLGGYADRDIRQGGKTLVGHPSNHAKGMAIDINPTRNTQGPAGVAKTDLPQEFVDYAKSLGFKWGGDYSGKTPKDYMHFEWTGSETAAQQQVQNLGLAGPQGTRTAGLIAAGQGTPTVLPALTPKDAGTIAAGTSVGMVGDPEIDKILATIRSQETPGSKTPYQQPNTAGSKASGAYQFMDNTWQSLTKQLGFGTQYKRAMDAPAGIQDKVAAAYVRQILKKAGGDVREVPKTWYIGHVGAPDSYFPGGKGNTLTAGQYADKWMKSYAGAKPTAAAGGATTETPGLSPGALPFGGSSLIGPDPLGLGAMSNNPWSEQPMSALQKGSGVGYKPTLAPDYKPTDLAPTISMAGKFASMMNPPYAPPIQRTIYGNDAPPLPTPPPMSILPDTAMPSTPLPKRKVGL